MLEARKQHLKSESAQAHGKVMSDIRKKLGRDAEGKSDDGVLRMYEAHNARLNRNLQQKADATHDERDAAMKSMTGKSLQDLENMSDEDMDKMAEKLEKKYGQ